MWIFEFLINSEAKQVMGTRVDGGRCISEKRSDKTKKVGTIDGCKTATALSSRASDLASENHLVQCEILAV